ncbi:MAG: peptide-methionine (S)-S-oxide reductase MsrA [Methanomassiliicoccales archaeon]|jgi:peptide-methionine (S)-S-oxide reductase
MNWIEVATFGLGCFWCGEAAFSDAEGVLSTRVGYMGGTTENPTYELVCSGRTGHIEVAEIRFDIRRTTYQQLLDIFWNSHNPVLNMEGSGESGGQYGSVIFYHSEEQKMLAEASKRRIQASGRFRGMISTVVRPASMFWEAEEYHQCYIQKTQQDEKGHGWKEFTLSEDS